MSTEKGKNNLGVNTGFGGSADTTTQAVEKLQNNLLSMLQFGVISEGKLSGVTGISKEHITMPRALEHILPLDDAVSATVMPESWTKATMIVRLNCLAMGVSGVRRSTVETLQKMLQKNITPRIPLRGSISASGDLSPLSYIGGVMQGKPALTVWTRDEDFNVTVKRANAALADHSIQPVSLQAKEGLAIVNGTATSTAVSSLALHETLGLAALSQILTAMTVEALIGTDESFDAFFGHVRPHPGQITAARNIKSFLSGSKLVNQGVSVGQGTLRQDRYSIRTAAQWIGPVLEDLQLAHQQLLVEMNSATDNPLIDAAGDARIMHGGNFQARSVTSAMEKARQGIQTLGRMLFSQCTEMINPATNRGLPPNLSADEPSETFTFKGVDIMMAALQSELGFLANPVGTHVQTAEMGNQGINSLALISSRYTLDAVNVLSQLCAAHLVAVCQALDLRVMHLKFLDVLVPDFKRMFCEAFEQYVKPSCDIHSLTERLWIAFQDQLEHSTAVDSKDRFQAASQPLVPLILESVNVTAEFYHALESWTALWTSHALHIYETTHRSYSSHPNALPYLGRASAKIYKFIRETLRVPFITNETLSIPNDGPAINGANGAKEAVRMAHGTTVGEIITKVYDAIHSGMMYIVAVECIRDVEKEDAIAPPRWCRHVDCTSTELHTPGKQYLWTNGVNGVLSHE